MIVRIISGQHNGIVGTMNGDLVERKKTLGKDGKVQVFTQEKRPRDILLIRTRHLEEHKDLFK